MLIVKIIVWENKSKYYDESPNNTYLKQRCGHIITLYVCVCVCVHIYLKNIVCMN